MIGAQSCYYECIFHQPCKNKAIWMHPRLQNWHFIDCILCRRSDIQDIRVTKSFRGANSEKDCRMIICRVNCNICPQHPKVTSQAKRKLNFALLSQPESHLNSKMHSLSIKQNLRHQFQKCHPVLL